MRIGNLLPIEDMIPNNLEGYTTLTVSFDVEDFDCSNGSTIKITDALVSVEIDAEPEAAERLLAAGWWSLSERR